MKTFREKLSPDLCSYPLSLIGPEEDLLFVDIETTGFAARSSSLYMIGCIYFKDGDINLVQWFAQRPDEEKDVLARFIDMAEKHKILVHYNGNNFDIPYMKQKCQYYGLKEPFSDMEGVDIYKRIMLYKKALLLDNVKQKTVESFLGIERKDEYNGGQLIGIYKEYCKRQTDYNLELLKLHNADDMRGMLSLLPILTYADIFLHPFRVMKVQSSRVVDPDGTVHTEVMMKLSFPFTFPKPVVMSALGCRFHCQDSEGLLKVPVYYGTMKYFYSNYKDYYYLPEEDLALHKSVATFVDSAHRRDATATTCYTKKDGAFLPQWDIIFQPVFKADYHDKLCYFELTDEIKHSPESFHRYALHILDMLAHGKMEE